MSERRIGLKELYRVIIRSPLYCRFAPVRYCQRASGLYAVEITMPDKSKRYLRTAAEYGAVVMEMALSEREGGNHSEVRHDKGG